MNRYIVVIIGLFALLVGGQVFAWTVLQAPIAANYPEWPASSLSLTFTITMFCFCIGGVIGGRLQQRFNHQAIIAICAILFAIGFGLASQATNLIMLYIGFGLIGGLATGVSYNVVISAVVCYFPDKQAVISGVLLMGFGFSSFIIGKAYTAVTPSDGSDAWRFSFLVLGAILCVIMLVVALTLKKPGPNFVAPEPKNPQKSRKVFEEVSPSRVLRRPAFWLCFAWGTLLTMVGMAVISQGTPISVEACPTLPMGDIATAVGLISIFNGVGRLTCGPMFESLGYKLSMVVTCLIFIAGFGLIIAALMSHSPQILFVSFIVLGFGYGNVPPTLSAFMYLFFGAKDYPTNFSMINLDMLIASFGSTIAGAVFDASGSYLTVLILGIVFSAISILSAIAVRKPKAAASESIAEN